MTNVERRVVEHGAGEGAKYTRSRIPAELVHVGEFDSKLTAIFHEYETKRLRHREKQ